MRLACKVGTVIRLGTFSESYNDAVDHSASRWLPSPENANEMVSATVVPIGRPAKGKQDNCRRLTCARRSSKRTRCQAEGLPRPRWATRSGRGACEG